MAKQLQLITFGAICAIVFFLFTGCQKSPLMESLLHAERSMDIELDSAQFILNGIKSLEGASDREAALYYLLKTELDDKQYITHTTDSFIQISTKYFESHNDLPRATKAYYYLGRIYSDMQEILQAQEYYLKALEVGEKIKDSKLLLKIYNSLGTLYTYQGIYDMALPMYKDALQYLTENKDSTYTSFLYRNIGRIYTQTNKIDSAIYYYKKALDFSTNKNITSLLIDLGNLHSNKNEYNKALGYLDQAKEHITNTKTLYPLYLSKGDLYLKMGKLDSAEFYANKSLKSSNIYTKAGSYYILSLIEKSKQNLKSYSHNIERYIQLQDSIKEFSNSENICKVQGMFDYQRIAKEKVKFEKEASQKEIEIYQITIFFVIIFIISFYFFKREQKKKKLLLELQQEQYKKSQQYIEDNKIQILKLENDLSSGKEQLSEVQKQLYEARKLMLEMENRHVILNQGTMHILEEDFKTSSLYLKAHSAEGQINQSEWAELRELIDATYSDFTTRLRKVYPRISNEELHICYLSKMGLPVKKIAAIMNITSSGVSQCRRRLYRKLTNEPANAEKFDIFISNF